jgi:hypothetical protein
MLDTSGKAWLIECIFGPALFDPIAGQELTTTGLKEYQGLYDLQGNKAIIDDRPMIADTVRMVFGTNETKKTRNGMGSHCQVGIQYMNHASIFMHNEKGDSLITGGNWRVVCCPSADHIQDRFRVYNRIHRILLV